MSEIQTKLCLAWFIARDTVPHTTAHRYRYLGNILRTRKDDGNLTTFSDNGGQEIFINLDGLVPLKNPVFFNKSD